MLRKAAFLAVSCCALLVGCGVDENQEIISNLKQAGFPADDITVVDGSVRVGGDAVVSLQASREMLQASKSTDEQYRTTNLVSTSLATICVTPTSAYASDSILMQALDGAIANYNGLGLTFTMSRGPGTCAADISAKTTTGAGGSSGFPSGGKPYRTINIGTGTTAYGVSTTRHVVMHELGHCVGFRHSDYYDRSISCGGSPTNEGASNVGAILIPGTPSTAKVGGSVMNSCFRANESGSWTNTDVTALQYLY